MSAGRVICGIQIDGIAAAGLADLLGSSLPKSEAARVIWHNKSMYTKIKSIANSFFGKVPVGFSFFYVLKHEEQRGDNIIQIIITYEVLKLG